MSFASFANGPIELKNTRISGEDAERQARAAREVLQRFSRQPGVILADEVGMGKTFVALAVAVSILMEREASGPIVVMTPPSLRHKWPKDWNVFVENCLSGELQHRFRANAAESGVGFLRLLDDPDERRSHIIFLTHGALHRAIGDGFAKLAVVKRAFKGRSSLAEQRRTFGRYAGRILRLEWLESRCPGLLADLLDRPCNQWLRTLHRAHPRFVDEVRDDPVPASLVDALEEMQGCDFESIVDALRYVPLRDSPKVHERLKAVREALRQEMEVVWQQAFRRARFHSPLLVLDEAHHLKNPATKLASLFVTEEGAAESGLFSSGGALAGKFDRMLFLTATPFQLGHAELIRVLERFEGIDWQGTCPPSIIREHFRSELSVLAKTLDDAQGAALRLDRAWGRLTAEHVGSSSSESDIDLWWESAKDSEGEGVVAQVVQHVDYTRRAMKEAERALAPWVLRHVRPTTFSNGCDVARRRVQVGASIVADEETRVGLEITPQTLLPFLLAGRAQGLLAACTTGRALFAEGLASSFEAYLDTRRGRATADEDAEPGESVVSPELQWYLNHLDQALPRDKREARSAHPKVRATTDKAIRLWKAGEKVLIFCHYRATGRALRQHISAALHREIL
ncbi:MAG: rapA 3, partial [Devosia sp.]|uniref:SNF2-related protein n=1 Tax=Devosia sp. TaxID=1871048 RepID=UPI00262A898A